MDFGGDTNSNARTEIKETELNDVAQTLLIPIISTIDYLEEMEKDLENINWDVLSSHLWKSKSPLWGRDIYFIKRIQI